MGGSGLVFPTMMENFVRLIRQQLHSDFEQHEETMRLSDRSGGPELGFSQTWTDAEIGELFRASVFSAE